MIVHFPTPYEDELLYSVIARYHVRVGNNYWKHTLEDLFGRRTVSASIFLPSGIDALVNCLPRNSVISSEELIKDHTFYRFFVSFLDRDRARLIYEMMLSDDGKKIYMQSGVMASGIRQNQHLKYCPKCFKECLDKHGELYWMRKHQMPGELICVQHKVWLMDSRVPIKMFNKHAFVLPTPENCDLSAIYPVSDSEFKWLKPFIESLDMLFERDFEFQTFNDFIDYYRLKLMENGLATANGSVRQKGLQRAFNDYYPEEFLRLIQCNKTERWLPAITRKHRKSFHPYYHALLLQFLGGSVADVFEEKNSNYYPFGESQWPCLNHLCSEYKRNSISTITIRHCEKTKKPIGRFTCHVCGFSYTRKGRDQNESDRYRYTKVMDFGFVWRSKLKELLKQNLSYREIARVLQADVGTIIKHSKHDENQSVKDSEKDKQSLIEQRRSVWLRLQQDYPHLSKTELRKKEPAVYTYLYRHDRDWLNCSSPSLSRDITKQNRVDWPKRDEEMLTLAQRAVESILNSPKWKRITKSRIATEAGYQALIEQHLEKMPKTKEYIEEVVESEDDFRVRRVNDVIKNMMENRDVLREWEVYRRANIQSDYKSVVKHLVENLRYK